MWTAAIGVFGTTGVLLFVLLAGRRVRARSRDGREPGLLGRELGERTPLWVAPLIVIVDLLLTGGIVAIFAR